MDTLVEEPTTPTALLENDEPSDNEKNIRKPHTIIKVKPDVEFLHTENSPFLARRSSYQFNHFHGISGNKKITDENGSTGDPHSIPSSRRPSAILSNIRRPSMVFAQKKLIVKLLKGRVGSKASLTDLPTVSSDDDPAYQAKLKNRRIAEDNLSIVLSAFYAKLIVVLGIALPVTDILSYKAPKSFYQGFYLYLYTVSVSFVVFMWSIHLRNRAVFTMINSYHQKRRNEIRIKHDLIRYGSFYLRLGAVAFGIGSMVYSGLEFGQYFELKGDDERCQNLLIALTPAARMLLSIVQMQFIFLNTKNFEMNRHKVIARFGLMHMIATNLCEWLYVLVEETKHEIDHINHSNLLPSGITNYTIPYAGVTGDLLDPINGTMVPLNLTDIVLPSHHIQRRAVGFEIIVECRRTDIMGRLIQNASPFLFPCTIEYSLICAVILFEMWKEIRGRDTEKPRERKISTNERGAHQFSIDCSSAHKGMFAGILVIVITIISLIMFFVLDSENKYRTTATVEMTISESLLYILGAAAVIGAFLKMRDLRYMRGRGLALDCNLLLLAQCGVYIYCMFSIIGSYLALEYEDDADTQSCIHALIAEVFCLVQSSLQTIFILNAWSRRCKGTHQSRLKPGRELVTFLLIMNMAMWFINTLVKGRAMFRQTHLDFYGLWAWTIITHVSMPLAIFYRFHSTICLFEIWKSTYKVRKETIEEH